MVVVEGKCSVAAGISQDTKEAEETKYKFTSLYTSLDGLNTK